MAYSEIYVDPSIAADSGTGTVGDPFGDLEYAIEQTTFDTTNGTRINVKAGTDEVLAAEIGSAMDNSVTTPAWVPTFAAQCVIQGYTSTAGDGGVGGISGGGSVGILNDATKNGIVFIDMHLHNTGANPVLDMNDNCTVIDCEVDNSTSVGIRGDAELFVDQCHIHNIGNAGVSAFGPVVTRCLFENGTNTFTNCIESTGTDISVYSRNIIKIGGASNGMEVSSKAIVTHNSIWSDGGTGSGIILDGTNRAIWEISNNIVAGFSGAGGVGYDLGDTTSEVFIYGANASYNNTTHYNTTLNRVYTLGDNETLTASPFTDPSTNDFSPVDTGNIKEGSRPATFPS